MEYARPIITPHALPQFKDTNEHKKKKKDKNRAQEHNQREGERDEQLKQENPIRGPFGRDGRPGSGTVTQFIMQNIHKLR